MAVPSIPAHHVDTSSVVARNSPPTGPPPRAWSPHHSASAKTNQSTAKPPHRGRAGSCWVYGAHLTRDYRLSRPDQSCDSSVAARPYQPKPPRPLDMTFG